MSYDDWKLRSPDQEPGHEEPNDGADHSSENDDNFCYECQRDADDCECDLGDPDADDRREGCVLGDECLHSDPFHLASECFTAEMAVAYFADEAEQLAHEPCPCCDQPRELWAPWSPCTDAPEGIHVP